jgi:hypothetical protein
MCVSGVLTILLSRMSFGVAAAAVLLGTATLAAIVRPWRVLNLALVEVIRAEWRPRRPAGGSRPSRQPMYSEARPRM